MSAIRRPIGIIPIAVFLGLATVIVTLVALSLLAPASTFAGVWVIKQAEYHQMLRYGGLYGAGFLGLALVMALASFGCFTRRRWGWMLATAVFIANGLGDAARLITGDLVGGLIGVSAAALIVTYLLSPAVRGWFRPL